MRAAASVVLATAYCVWSRSLKSRLPIASSFQQVEPWAGMMKPWSLSTWNRPDNFLGAVLVSYRALCRAPTAGVTDGLEQQSRRARRTCRFNTPTVPPLNETRDLHWFNTIEVTPCVTVPQGCAQVDRVGRICIVGLRLVRQRTVYVFVPQSLSCDGRSGGQRGGADRRRCPVWRPLRFLAAGCQAVGVSASWGRVRNTRRNLPI